MEKFDIENSKKDLQWNIRKQQDSRDPSPKVPKVLLELLRKSKGAPMASSPKLTKLLQEFLEKSKETLWNLEELKSYADQATLRNSWNLNTYKRF